MRRIATGLVALCCVSAAGCAFFGKSEPFTPRFYSAERAGTPGPAAAVATPDVRLRLGGIVGGSHLRERIAYRSGERELGFYEGRRWAERPEVYLRRALSRALFEERGLGRAISGLAPTLEVELTDFDELRIDPHRVRVRAHVLLIDARTVRFEHTFGADEAVAEGEDDDDAYARVADAFARALGKVVDEISDRIVAELRTPPPSAAPTSAPAP
jgi:ABC-type uncharacterized transport system auxiliary subunit